MPRSLKSRLNHTVEPHVTKQAARLLPNLAPWLMQFGLYWPHDYKQRSFSLPLADVGTVHDGMPVPPRDLWAYYCTSAESYLASGREDCDDMGRILSKHGAAIEDAGRILDLGCAAGRMVRWIPGMAPGAEVWGTDVWSTAILWCQDHLTPACRFAVSTISPHLPFEDRYFGLVYCGSLFSQIDDLTETWFLELRRIVRPGGHLYFSVNDRHAAAIFAGAGDPAARERYYERTGGREAWDRHVAKMAASPDFQRFVAGDAYMVTVGRSMVSNTLWDADVLCERLAYGWRTLAITPESYGHQTTVLLERV
jgi:SAM-dependent methyltransferase